MKITLRLPLILATAIALCACSPQYNWREAHGDTNAFSILLPAKASSYSRPVSFGATQAVMTMTAAEVDDVSFAVGTAELPDAAQAQAALAGMRAALAANVGGTPRDGHIPGSVAGAELTLDLEADGNLRGKPALLTARFAARGRRVYQLLVLGPTRDIKPENIETFFTSFKPA